MSNNILDRFFCVLFYWTIGFFGIIYLIFAYMNKKTISSFVLFNIYQSLFISVLLYILSFVYGIFINIIGVIPVIGKAAVLIDVIVFRQPIVFGMSIMSCCLVTLLTYFSICCLMNRYPYIPFVSQIVKENFGG